MLVVGGSGYLGQHLAHALAQRQQSQEAQDQHTESDQRQQKGRHVVGLTYLRHPVAGYTGGPQFCTHLGGAAAATDARSVAEVLAEFQPEVRRRWQRTERSQTDSFSFSLHLSEPVCVKVQQYELSVASSVDVGAALRIGAVQVVVNCAAVSQPRVCEEDTAAAMATNDGGALIAALQSAAYKTTAAPPLLVHLSTDQVFDGRGEMVREEEEPRPVNAYGRYTELGCCVEAMV